jgi:LuxR family maltose regulon positive regulatory protein
LQPKLYIPPPHLIPRLRLIDPLNQGLQGPLTLITAPANVGKTRLVSAQVGQSQRQVVWLLLDQPDNDSTRFLIYFVSVLPSVRSGIGVAILAALPSPAPVEATLTLAAVGRLNASEVSECKNKIS